jgi:hypothetical protein
MEKPEKLGKFYLKNWGSFSQKVGEVPLKKSLKILIDDG